MSVISSLHSREYLRSVYIIYRVNGRSNNATLLFSVYKQYKRNRVRSEPKNFDGLLITSQSQH